MDISLERLLSGMFKEPIYSGKKLFFIQGLWRSGTSWLGRLIGDHPKIYVCQHELQAFVQGLEIKYLGQALNTHPFLNERHHVCQKIGFLTILRHLYNKEKPAASIIGERSPGADVQHLKQNFPDAKLVIILRDGRDICVSTAYHERKHLHENHERIRLEPAFVQAMAQLYLTYVRDYFALKDRHPNTVFLLRYEDLHRDAAAVMQEVFKFLGVELAPETVMGICRKRSFDAEFKKTGGNAHMRKGRVGDWQNHFSDECSSAFAAIAGEALQLGGYK